MRIEAVTIFKSAQRPVSSRPSSQRAICAGNCALPSVSSVSTTSVRLGTAFSRRFGSLGHISATVSDRSPT
jgi:hypothetical protein